MPVIATAREDGLLTIELCRPEALNAFTRELGEALLDAVRAAAADPDVRAMMITGAGRGFSSGADLRAERKLTFARSTTR
jgi:2-(1,2-epoxy-1,2-dihydrophenyl)acetyl-CoA isomerase